MNGHPQFEEDFELYALGALDGDEKNAFEAHLSGCLPCRVKLEAARGQVALLALSAPPVALPPGARRRVMEFFRAGRAALPSPVPSPASRPVRPSWGAPVWALATLVFLLASAWLAVENRKLSSELSSLDRTSQQLEESRRQLVAEGARAQAALDVLTAPETVQVDLSPVAARPIPHGKAFYNSSKGLLFYAANLPPLPTGRTYELWLIPSQGAPVSAGVFYPDARGNAQVILPRLPQGLAAKAFAVTIEPAGGVSAPSGPKVIIGLAS